ncbi:hypothetical protein ADUPG1_011026 [Aduncisulcus paluster]|uniref:Uncharacterized protein n=1 Tax=Aduncisulcus paluster TaxID=2918883 RepID=A0ABQ5JTX3_9EUKA|nr:hypothetical protein ADUPG1_011026 [Aduncisulcus paluster]
MSASKTQKQQSLRPDHPPKQLDIAAAVAAATAAASAAKNLGLGNKVVKRKRGRPKGRLSAEEKQKQKEQMAEMKKREEKRIEAEAKLRKEEEEERKKLNAKLEARRQQALKELQKPIFDVSSDRRSLRSFPEVEYVKRVAIDSSNEHLEDPSASKPQRGRPRLPKAGPSDPLVYEPTMLSLDEALYPLCQCSTLASFYSSIKISSKNSKPEKRGRKTDREKLEYEETLLSEWRRRMIALVDISEQLICAWMLSRKEPKNGPDGHPDVPGLLSSHFLYPRDSSVPLSHDIFLCEDWDGSMSPRAQSLPISSLVRSSASSPSVNMPYPSMLIQRFFSILCNLGGCLCHMYSPPKYVSAYKMYCPTEPDAKRVVAEVAQSMKEFPSSPTRGMIHALSVLLKHIFIFGKKRTKLISLLNSSEGSPSETHGTDGKTRRKGEDYLKEEESKRLFPFSICMSLFLLFLPCDDTSLDKFRLVSLISSVCSTIRSSNCYNTSLVEFVPFLCGLVQDIAFPSHTKTVGTPSLPPTPTTTMMAQSKSATRGREIIIPSTLTSSERPHQGSLYCTIDHSGLAMGSNPLKQQQKEDTIIPGSATQRIDLHNGDDAPTITVPSALVGDIDNTMTTTGSISSIPPLPESSTHVLSLINYYSTFYSHSTLFVSCVDLASSVKSEVLLVDPLCHLIDMLAICGQVCSYAFQCESKRSAMRSDSDADRVHMSEFGSILIGVMHSPAFVNSIQCVLKLHFFASLILNLLSRYVQITFSRTLPICLCTISHRSLRHVQRRAYDNLWKERAERRRKEQQSSMSGISFHHGHATDGISGSDSKSLSKSGRHGSHKEYDSSSRSSKSGMNPLLTTPTRGASWRTSSSAALSGSSSGWVKNSSMANPYISSLFSKAHQSMLTPSIFERSSVDVMSFLRNSTSSHDKDHGSSKEKGERRKESEEESEDEKTVPSFSDGSLESSKKEEKSIEKIKNIDKSVGNTPDTRNKAIPHKHSPVHVDSKEKTDIVVNPDFSFLHTVLLSLLTGNSSSLSLSLFSIIHDQAAEKRFLRSVNKLSSDGSPSSDSSPNNEHIDHEFSSTMSLLISSPQIISLSLFHLTQSLSFMLSIPFSVMFSHPLVVSSLEYISNSIKNIINTYRTTPESISNELSKYLALRPRSTFSLVRSVGKFIKENGTKMKNISEGKQPVFPSKKSKPSSWQRKNRRSGGKSSGPRVPTTSHSSRYIVLDQSWVSGSSVSLASKKRIGSLIGLCALVPMSSSEQIMCRAHLLLNKADSIEMDCASSIGRTLICLGDTIHLVSTEGEKINSIVSREWQVRLQVCSDLKHELRKMEDSMRKINERMKSKAGTREQDIIDTSYIADPRSISHHSTVGKRRESPMETQVSLHHSQVFKDKKKRSSSVHRSRNIWVDQVIVEDGHLELSEGEVDSERIRRLENFIVADAMEEESLAASEEDYKQPAEFADEEEEEYTLNSYE